MGTSPPSRCHLLRLATETLHSICELLEDDGALTELANLRLTCRALQVIPEEYLFRYICLDSCFDSLEGLQQLSRHHRISQCVVVLKVDISFMIETLTHDEYNAKVAGYGSLKPERLGEGVENEGSVEGVGPVAMDVGVEEDTESDDEEEWPPLGTYDKLLAQERDSLAPSELAACWNRCERTQLQQKKLKAMTLQELVDFLQPVFASLLNLTRLNCEALGIDQYEFDEDGNRKLKLSQQRTLLPPIYHHEPDQEEQDSVVKYSTACVAAVLLAGSRIYSLELSGVPWDTLLALSEYVEFNTAFLALAQVTRLHLSLKAWKAASDEDKTKGMVVVTKMLAMAPDLEKFKWMVGNHPGCDFPPFSLPDRHLLSSSPKLRKFTIGAGQLACSSAALANFLTALPDHIRCLKLHTMFLQDGAWVDVFRLLHDQLRLEKFDFHELVECDPVDRHVRRWLVRYQEEPVQASLLERLRNYITRKTATPPLTPSALGGSPELWESKCDGSLIYDTIGVQS